ncbi:hypothetical protein BAE44_0009663 [Dichanthelium oligosanthes]|uniref:Uncharacterized protein n=1 Tax=Dichanthelium oligosanthes TaxID=888268 RepID=A0A1E5VW41_9POAL|nr:hypothetical protein BAE44_0009663 [Dichanthelium oligosanthes]
MVLGLCRCFGAAPATEGKKPAPGQQLVAGGEEQKKQQQAAGDQEAAGGEAGEPKMAVDRSMVVKEKRAPAPEAMHQFPFHSRPGLM